LIPTSQGISLDEKLTELGVEQEFTLYENEGHGWVGINLFDISTKLKAFIEKHL
jgi:acetyl esterase/lipase